MASTCEQKPHCLNPLQCGQLSVHGLSEVAVGHAPAQSSLDTQTQCSEKQIAYQCAFLIVFLLGGTAGTWKTSLVGILIASILMSCGVDSLMSIGVLA